MINDADAPFALADPSEMARRRGMLVLPHMIPLVAHVGLVAADRGCELPMFDPCDGGVEARILFLLEAPGPKAVGSMFISRNNPDLSAKNMNLLLQEAGIARKDTVLWNIIPWYIGSGTKIRSANKADKVEALPYLGKLLTCLPKLQAVVLAGGHADSMASNIRQLTSVPLYSMAHPSPRVYHTMPHKRGEALKVLQSLRAHLSAAS